MLKQLTVHNLRPHAKYEMSLDPRVTLIVGPNGTGKTSLLEAIYIACQGKSFKGVDGDIVTKGLSWYRVDVLSDDSVRTVKYDSGKTSCKKQFDIDGKVHYRLNYQQKKPVVLFEPGDLRLLNGSPSRRRDFLDTLIGQLDPLYATHVSRYERALRQRNNLLKQDMVTKDDIFAWDVSLSRYGAYILGKRMEYVERLNARLGDIYRDIAQKDDIVQVAYSHIHDGNIEQRLLRELHSSFVRDMHLGYTSVGPHRHDMLLSFNGYSALSVASRGEVRTTVLALKLIEVGLVEHASSSPPIVLLDDVFSELDEKRQHYLTREMSRDYQIVITTATTSEAMPRGRVIHLV